MSDIEQAFGAEFAKLWEVVSPYTIVSLERAYATYRACRHVARYRLQGAFAECGVFRGGMTMLAAHLFSIYEHQTRDLWLYDTFAGMTPPTEHDGELAEGYERTLVASGLPEVQSHLELTKYPKGRIHFIEGDVCETLKQSANIPDRIAVLRLDTDWYDSTKAELEILYDKVVPGGVILCDDYGFWQGARKAMDEFVELLPYPVYLCRTDGCGVEFVKPL